MAKLHFLLLTQLQYTSYREAFFLSQKNYTFLISEIIVCSYKQSIFSLKVTLIYNFAKIDIKSQFWIP